MSKIQETPYGYHHNFTHGMDALTNAVSMVRKSDNNTQRTELLDTGVPNYTTQFRQTPNDTKLYNINREDFNWNDNIDNDLENEEDNSLLEPEYKQNVKNNNNIITQKHTKIKTIRRDLIQRNKLKLLNTASIIANNTNVTQKKSNWIA